MLGNAVLTLCALLSPQAIKSAPEAAGSATAKSAISSEPIVTWRGNTRPLAALAQDAPSAATAASHWLEFADAAHYRLVLSNDSRVLLLLSETFARKPNKENHEVEVMLDLVRDTCAVSDRFLGSKDAKDAPPLVLVCSRSKDYPKVLEQVAKLDPRLHDWSERAGRAVTGFILSEPLLAAWIEDPSGVEEWQPYNELVHRAAQLLVRRQAGLLPPWLTLGLGWHVEDTVRECIYCFPHRAGFVSAASHTDWGIWLLNAFKKERRKKAQKTPVLGIDEFAGWHPGVETDEFDSGKAYIAFGVARYLAHEHATKVPALLEQMNAAMQKGSKVWTSATEWRTDPDYQMPVAEQLALLQKLDDHFLQKVTDYFVGKKANERRAPKAKHRP